MEQERTLQFGSLDSNNRSHQRWWRRMMMEHSRQKEAITIMTTINKNGTAPQLVLRNEG